MVVAIGCRSCSADVVELDSRTRTEVAPMSKLVVGKRLLDYGGLVACTCFHFSTSFSPDKVEVARGSWRTYQS